MGRRRSIVFRIGPLKTGTCRTLVFAMGSTGAIGERPTSIDQILSVQAHCAATLGGDHAEISPPKTVSASAASTAALPALPRIARAKGIRRGRCASLWDSQPAARTIFMLA